MSNAQRLFLLVAAVVVLGGALILLTPGSDDTSNDAATTSTPAATTAAPAATTAAPKFTVVTVKGAKPAGGVQTITAHKDDIVRIEVTTPDTTSEVHLHGYDIKRELEAGGSVRFVFRAKNEGIFEMELEQTAVQIVKLVIEP
jgi:FtsP/CotA-like multicopper oxidase with cupredoxin domain